MAKIKIYNEITDEQGKIMLQDWFGSDGVCYKDVAEFLDNMEEGDNNIDMLIHCPGGNCLEGWAIYDKLRSSGKEISATIEGDCSSMASVLLLAAPKEKRFAFENARMCIHNPAFNNLDAYTCERLTADEIERLKNKLTAQQVALAEEQNKILNLYVERTGTDRETLQTLMNEDKYIFMDKAKELGFITDTIAPNTAYKSNIKSRKQMTEQKVTIESNVVKRLLALAGIAKIEDVQVPLNQKVTAADGTEFTVEREDGDPQVGDKAYPNGEYVLEDGTTIVVEDEVIISITLANEGEDAPEEGEAEDDKDAQIADLTAQVETLTSENETLKAENEQLKATVEDNAKQVETLQSEKDALTEAQKSEEDEAILETVARAGGKEWLDNVCSMQSTFNAGNRQFVPRNSKENNGESKTQKLLRETKEKFAASRK